MQAFLLVASLIFAHFFGDYFLQRVLQKFLRAFDVKYTKTGWQMLAHCALYLTLFPVIFWIFKIQWAWFALLFASHLIIDSVLLNVKENNRYKGMSYLKRLMKLDPVLAYDQLSHLLFVFVIFIVWAI